MSPEPTIKATIRFPAGTRLRIDVDADGGLVVTSGIKDKPADATGGFDLFAGDEPHSISIARVYCGVGIETDQGLIGVAQRDDGIEVNCGDRHWSSTTAWGNAQASEGT